MLCILLEDNTFFVLIIVMLLVFILTSHLVSFQSANFHIAKIFMKSKSKYYGMRIPHLLQATGCIRNPRLAMQVHYVLLHIHRPPSTYKKNINNSNYAAALHE